MHWIRTFFLMSFMTLILMVIGSLVGGRSGAILALVVAGVMNLGAYFSDKMVLARYKAKEIGPEDGTGLYGIVKDLSTRSGLPMPRVYLIPTETPNAFATGRSPRHAAVAATQGILRLLSPRELQGVMAHELAHVQNRDILIQSIAAALASALEKISAGVVRRPMGDEAATTAHLFIVNPLHGGGLSKLFSTHPPLEERVARLRAMPARG